MSIFDQKLRNMSLIKNRLHDSALELILKPATIQDAMFQHSVLCQTFLPYRNPGDDVTTWEQQQGNVSLAVQSMKAFNPETQKLEVVGLPYGTKSRLIMAHINSQAIKTQNKTLDIESSLSGFIKTLGLTTDGRTINDTKDQLRRLTTSIISLGYFSEDKNYQVDLKIVKGFDINFSKDSNKRVNWSSEIILTDDYYNSLMQHAIPLDERALAALSHNAMALDIYAWLAQRLHRISYGTPQFVSWQNLKDQFGGGYKDMKKFKEVFRKTLFFVRLQYQAARLDEDNNKGFILHNSPTPIPMKGFLIK
jgi:Plasmid encoded RepA protein